MTKKFALNLIVLSFVLTILPTGLIPNLLADSTTILVTPSGVSSSPATGETQSIYIGNSAGSGSLITGNAANIGIGDDAGRGVTGVANTATGVLAGRNVTGSFNTASGYEAGRGMTGDGNTTTGVLAGRNVTGSFNTASGYEAGRGVTGDGNTATGVLAGRNVTGSFNTASGYEAGRGVTGVANTATGVLAGRNVTGSFNLASGVEAGRGVTGNSNTAMGDSAGSNVTGSNNIALGTNAGRGTSSSPLNVNNTVSIGNGALTGKNGSIAMGQNSQASGSQSVAIGSGSTASGSNSVALGANSIDNGRANTVSVGAPGAERTISNVSPGTVSTDAVNLSQLQGAVGQAINYTVTHTAERIAINNSGGLPNPQATGANSVALGPGSNDGGRANTLSVGAAGAERTISNVAAGTAPTDAVNVSQFQGLSSRVDHLERTMQGLDSKLSQGIAATAALVNNTPYIPGVTAISVGGANFNGASGLGLTISRWSSNGLINFNAGVAFAGSSDSTVVRGGITFVLK